MSDGQQQLLPAMPDDLEAHLLELSAPMEGNYTGDSIAASPRAMEICRAVTLGDSQRAIAAREGVSRKALRAFLEQAERAGLIAPLKERLSKRVGQAAMASTEQLLEAVEEGKISAGQLPVAAAILIDKTLVMGGDPTAIVEHRSGDPGQALEDYLASIPEAKPAPEHEG